MEELHFEAILSLNDTASFDQEVRFTVHPKEYVASSIVYSRSLQVKRTAPRHKETKSCLV